MPLCRACGGEITERDRFCNACGAAIPSWSATAAGPSGRSRASIGGHLVIIAGCLGLIAGPLLPWATSMLFDMSGIEYTDYRAMSFVMLGILGLVLAVASLARKRDTLRWAPFVIGAIGLGLSTYYLVDLHARLPHLVQELFGAWLGVGIFVCIVGSVVILVGAAAVARRRR